MTRKTRYWVCDSCPHIYLRKKNDGWMSCYDCFGDMRKATKYPYVIGKRLNKQATNERKQRETLKGRHNRCRNTFGYRLVVSTETRKAFKDLKAAKQRRSFIRRANTFLEKLKNDVWSLNGRLNENPEQHVTRAPTCELTILIGDSLLGNWNPAPFTVDLQWKDKGIVETMIHEAVHYVDWMGGISRERCVGAHTQAFYQRCRDLGRMLNHTAKEAY